MPKENLSVSLPPEIRSLIELEAKRGKRSRSAVVRDALQLYFKLRQIGIEESHDRRHQAFRLPQSEMEDTAQ